MRLNDNLLQEVTEWINKYIETTEVITELYIIGSILKKEPSLISDVDIVQVINYKDVPDLRQHANFIKRLRNDFEDKFKKSLHVTSFTQNELKDYKSFILVNQKIKIK
jgi:predicted nucleotidyltransferase